MRLLSAATAVSAVGATSYIVNDGDAGMESSTWGEGWFSPCGDAYGATASDVNYHMDWAGENGPVSVDITAPLATEEPFCMRLEEWHPGRTESCSHYLPTNAPLTIHLAEGESTTVIVDQSVNGGQWNALGHFMLAAEGPHATFSNNGGRLTCGASMCWWVADAFRFTEVDAANCGVASADTVPAPEYAELPVSVSYDECTSFGEELLEVVGACDGATTCGADEFALGHTCRTGAAAFAEKYEFVMARCLMSCMKDKRELKTLGLEVEAVLGCPESNAVDEFDAEQQARADAQSDPALLRGSSSGSAEEVVVAQAAEAMEFNGDCTEFAKFAQQVVDACSSSTCCADVVEDDSCRYYAAGLHSLYPSNAINFCARMVRLERKCTCFVRQVSACALQAEVHEILYNERWAPTCSRFPAMALQQDPAYGGEHSSTVIRHLLFVISAVALVAVCAACNARSNAKTTDMEEDAPTAEEVTVVGDAVDAVQDAVEVKAGLPVTAPVTGMVLVVDGE